MRFKKYKQNLRKEGDFIISYTTKVARINRGETHLTELGIWSPTTTKHIKYAATELGLTLINYKSKGYCNHCEETKTDINSSYCSKGCEDAEIKLNQLNN